MSEISRQAVADCILTALHQLGEDLQVPPLQDADLETRLFGEKSGIDSMMLVTIIAEVEEALAENLGCALVLADERAMSQSRSPFRRVHTLIDYAWEAIQSAAS